MEKLWILERLAQVRERAEAAHLQCIVQGQVRGQLEGQGLDATEAKSQVTVAKTAELRYLKEIDWLLDQLEKIEKA